MAGELYGLESGGARGPGARRTTDHAPAAACPLGLADAPPAPQVCHNDTRAPLPEEMNQWYSSRVSVCLSVSLDARRGGLDKCSISEIQAVRLYIEEECMRTERS